MSEKAETKSAGTDLGYDLYPERRSKKEHIFFTNSFNLFETTNNREKLKCESKVIKAMKKHPLVKVLLGALKKNGCPVSIRRHVSCEPCDTKVTGGYDTESNQIVVCQNSKKVAVTVEPVLVHELIHMYDYCIGKIDFKNLEHLACTEIRAANLSHCSFMSSMLLAESSPFNIKQTHQNCVKLKAAQSIMISRNLDFDTAMEAISKVFNKCYNDLEPIGRRIRRSSVDGDLSLKEAEHFDFCLNKTSTKET